MASTPQSRRLTEAHRLAQARLGARTVRALLATWALMDPNDLDGSLDRWLTTVIPIINGQRAVSARLAANYLSTFKALELGVSAAPLVLADSANTAAVTTSMTVTGPIAVKTHMRTNPVAARAMEVGRTMSARAGMRHVLDGGRSTITQTVQADPQALGWARATSGKPCAFCAMVASRGPVYKSEGTADFEPHDGCSCSAEPVYREDAAWPAGSDRWSALWAEASDAEGDTAKNFRQLVEQAA